MLIIEMITKSIHKIKVFLFRQSAGESFIDQKVQGGALYIAIIIGIIIGILLSMFILITKYNQRTVTVFSQNSQLHYNLESAFQMAQSGYFTQESNNKWMKNIFNDDSIRIRKIYWGVYLMITAETKNRHNYLSQSGFYGTAMSADTGIMVADNSRPMGVSGSVTFKSNCYLPNAGIKSAYIEGQSYISNLQNSSFIKAAPFQIPGIQNGVITGLRKQQESLANLDSVVNELPENYDRSFSLNTVAWKTSASMLTQLNLKDNIKIICGNIEVDSSSHLENVLIICNKARFKNGFKGKVHVIASDSIVMEKKCEFEYPSSFVLLPTEENSNSFNYINFNEDCRFFGAVLALNEGRPGSNQKVFVKLNAKSEVNGLIYSNDFMHLEGKVNATAICNKLLLKTPSAVYENHILACKVDPHKYGHLLAVPLLFNERSRLLCCEKMN
jgi:hypothetical protein